MDHKEVADSESYSGSGSIHRDGHEDGDFLYEEKSDDRSENGVDNDDDDTPVGSDEEGNVQVRRKVVQVDPKEQEDFDRELKALLQESLESRKELRAKPTLNMTVPMNVFEGSKDPTATEAKSGQENTAVESGNAGCGSNVKVCVRVLVKKGHKQQTKQMFIPGHCSLVQSTKQQEAAEIEEKQNIKRKILEYNEREEEESNGGSLQTGYGGQGGSIAGSSINSSWRGSWDGSNRVGGAPQRYYIAGGIYHGYGRGR